MQEENVVLQEINGRIFRKAKIKHNVEYNTTNSNRNNNNNSKSLNIRHHHDEYTDERECSTEYNIERDDKTGICKIKFNLPKIFYKFVIGKAGNAKNKIENETGATIIIPKVTSPFEEIVIKGQSEGSVISAKTRLDLIVESALQSLPYTHFLSIPLTDTTLQQRLQALEDDILAHCSDAEGLEKSILIEPTQFHVTILMMKLYTTEAVNKAQQILKNCGPAIYDIVGTRSIVVHLQGLEYMNDDPKEVDILYAKVNPSDGSKQLADLCKLLVNAFSMANLVTPQDRDVKLHATLINTKLRSNISGVEERDNNTRQAIDATSILQAFGNVDLGTYRIPSVHLSQRGAFDAASSYWKCVASVPLP